MNKRTRRYLAYALVLALALAFAAAPASAAERERALSIEGARMQGELLHVYFQAITNEPLTDEKVTATLDGAPLIGASLHPYAFADAGVTWCVVADLSSSEAGRAMRDAKACAKVVAERMLPYDKGCVVSSGPVDAPVSLLKAQDAMLESADGLALNPRGADVYATVGNVVKALQEDGESTARRCILLLSDAMGDYGGDAQEARALVEKAGVPVYVVALLYGTSDKTRQQNAAALQELSAASPGGTYYETGSGHPVEEGVAPVLAFRENGYTLALAKEDVRACTNAATGELTITAEDGALTLSDTFKLDLSAIPAAAEPAPTAAGTPMPESAPAPTAVPEEQAKPAGLALPWILGIAAGALLLAAGAALLIVRAKKRKKPLELDLGDEVYLSMEKAPEEREERGDAMRASLCLKPLSGDAAPIELDMAGRLVIGSDPRRAQLILDGTDGVQCVLIRRADGLFLLPGDTPGGTRKNDLPVAEEAPVVSGDALRLGETDYTLLWQ